MVILRDGDAEMLSSLSMKKHESRDGVLGTLIPDPCLFST